MLRHQYVDRISGEIRTERIYADRIVNLLYGPAREHAPQLFRALTGARASRWLGYLNYDFPFGGRLTGNLHFMAALGVALEDCLDPPDALDSARKVFERRIRYWDCRPLPADPHIVVSPADARVLVGSMKKDSALHLKGRFFDLEELLGGDKRRWLQAFQGGDFAVFRLTPDKYHYNHAPVAGRVLDYYVLDGRYHACNPTAVVALATPYSKNRRMVTIIDSDVSGGTGVGLVAMIEVVALMIGDIVQCYSEERYEYPQPVMPGLFLARGAPKSLYRPGSSTDVLLFQPGRLRFDPDLVANLARPSARSRFTAGFHRPLLETEVQVRSSIGRRHCRR